MQFHWSNLLEASVVAIRTSVSNQASKLIAKIMPAQPGPWHGVVARNPLDIPLQALSQSCLMVVMMMVAQRCSQWERMMIIMLFTRREGVSY